MDKQRFRDRNKRITDYTNANLFISNNANPFLISPYTPINTAQFAKATVIDALQELISTTIGNISTILDPLNFSLKISTIYPADGATSSITLFGSTIIDDYLTVSGIADFNIINATTANLQNITASTILTQYDITSQSSMTTNYMTVNNALVASDISVSSITASTILAQYDITSQSSMTTNYMTVNNTLVASDISVSSITASTILSQYDITSQSSMSSNTLSGLEIIFSSISCQPGVVSTATTTVHSSILINVGGTMYKIPLELA
jgi:hypothetical protein